MSGQTTSRDIRSLRRAALAASKNLSAHANRLSAAANTSAKDDALDAATARPPGVSAVRLRSEDDAVNAAALPAGGGGRGEDGGIAEDAAHAAANAAAKDDAQDAATARAAAILRSKADVLDVAALLRSESADAIDAATIAVGGCGCGGDGGGIAKDAAHSTSAHVTANTAVANSDASPVSLISECTRFCPSH